MEPRQHTRSRRIRARSAGVVLAAASVFAPPAGVLHPPVPAAAAADAPAVQQVSEYELKAAMMRHFIRYTRWPKRSLRKRQDVVVGIVGKNPFDRRERRVLTRHRIGKRRVRIKVFAKASEIRGVHALFIPRSASGALRDEALEEVAGDPVLTIGEEKGFLKAGGLFNFVIRRRKVRFQIDNAEARDAGLEVSTKLLKLAVEEP